MTEEDPDYCGLGKLNTGKHDPYWPEACTVHDQDFEQKKGTIETFLRFTKNASVVAVKGAYAVTAYPLYLLIGGIGGILRQEYNKRRK